MKKIAIFASGNGSNAKNIISHFYQSKIAKVVILLSNKSDALAIDKARNLAIPSFVFSPNELKDSLLVDQLLENCEVDYIVLAGFLLLFPERLVKKYSGRIVNIHPSLLPAFGGRGMYGMNVHRAVVEAKVSESGITIHQVNEQFDDGAIIFQERCNVTIDDTADTVAAKISQLEIKYFPSVIESFILKNT